MHLPVIGHVQVIGLCRVFRRQRIDIFDVGDDPKFFPVIPHQDHILTDIAKRVLPRQPGKLEIGKTEAFRIEQQCIRNGCQPVDSR